MLRRALLLLPQTFRSSTFGYKGRFLDREIYLCIRTTFDMHPICMYKEADRRRTLVDRFCWRDYRAADIRRQEADLLR